MGLLETNVGSVNKRKRPWNNLHGMKLVLEMRNGAVPQKLNFCHGAGFQDVGIRNLWYKAGLRKRVRKKH